MHIAPALTASTLLLASHALAQSAIPPSTFPDVSSTPIPSSSNTPTVTFTVTTSLPSSASSGVSSSGTVSGNATSSIPFPPLNTVSPCVSNCLAQAIATVGCSSVVDVNCFCPINRFPLTYMNCIVGGCPSDSLSSAESLANQFCQLSNSTTATSLSFPPVPQTSSSNGNGGTTTVTVPSPGASATGTNAAIGLLGYGVGSQGLIGGVMVVLSVMLGAVFV